MRSAMDVFWSEGFHAASMSQLGAAMGLRPGSIYAAFESKEALFREALAVYVSDIRAAANEVSDPASLLEGWFAAHVARSLRGQRGCLLLNTSTERKRMDADSAEAVTTALTDLETSFTNLVKKVRKNPNDRSARATARLLISALMGISTFSRAGAPAKTLRDIADAALASV